MNIAFYTKKECFPNIGGIERTTSLVACNLKQLYNYGIYHIYEQKIESSDYLFEFDDTLEIKLDDSDSSKLQHFITSNKISIIINQGYFKFGSFLNRIITKFDLSCKQIFALHFSPGDMEKLVISPYEIFRMWKNSGHFKHLIKLALFPIFHPYKTCVFKMQYRDAEMYSNKIVLLSDSHKDMWTSFAHTKNSKSNSTKYVVIPNALPFNFEMSKIDILSKEKKLLVVARLNERTKKISKVIEIWKMIEKNPILQDWSLDIVGDGSDKRFYEDTVHKFNIPRIQFFGNQNPIKFYKKSSIFLMTSLSEGFGMTLVEASKFGTVPIAFNSFSAIKDIITDGKNGILVPPFDLQSFGMKIIELAKNENLRLELALNAIANSKRFSQNCIAKMWNDLILQTMEE